MQKKEAEKAAVAFLDKAQNFSKITNDNCLDRLTMANARGDLNMSEDEISKVATDQAYAAAASFISHNQMPMLSQNDLNSKPSAKHNRAPQPQPAAMTPFTSSTVSSITDATPDYVKVVRDMAIDKMMESTDAETELKLNKVVDELSGEGKNASLVNIIKRGDETHKDPEKVLTACMNRMN